MRFVREFCRFISHVYNNSALIITLIRNDFLKQYLGSYLGLVWAFVQPLVFMGVIWFVFEIGFKAKPVNDDTSFFLWLMAGMLPWLFFAECLSAGVMAVVHNRFLVKKVAFRVGILPIIPLGSAFILHFCLVITLMVIFFFHGLAPSVYWLQLPYYMVCITTLLLGLCWLTSAIYVFIKDIGNVIAVCVQFGFWATPIFWSSSLVPEQYVWLIKLNPMFYIVQGYRDTFIDHIWFWQHPGDTFYFIAVASFFFIAGGLVFTRLRPHFGDVL